MEFRKPLREIRANRNAENHFQWILASLKKQPRRRLQVRALLAKSRTEWRRERAAHFAEMAGDVLWTILKKPKCAEIVYRYALTIADDPLPSLMAIFKIAESQNRYYVAYEVARRIFDTASKMQSDSVRERLQLMAPIDSMQGNRGFGSLAQPYSQLMNLQTLFASTTQTDSAKNLRKQCLDLLFDEQPDSDEFQRRVRAIQWWLACDSLLRTELVGYLRSKQRFQNVIFVLSLCAEAAKESERNELLMQLGHVYRFGVGELELAKQCFERIVKTDPEDREAWGELLELLSDLDDDDGLAKALKTRIEISVGLEQRELMRQRTLLLSRLKAACAGDFPASQAKTFDEFHDSNIAHSLTGNQPDA